MLNVLVQTPRGVVPKTQLYATIGGGVFRERFDALDIQETGCGTNVGGGAKIELVGTAPRCVSIIASSSSRATPCTRTHNDSVSD